MIHCAAGLSRRHSDGNRSRVLTSSAVAILANVAVVGDCLHRNTRPSWLREIPAKSASRFRLIFRRRERSRMRAAIWRCSASDGTPRRYGC
jgi:hypothetical protein